MFSFLKNESENSTIMALDIGTESIKTLLIDTKDNKGEIIGKGQVRQKLDDLSGGGIVDIGSIIDHCQEAIKLAERQGSKSGKELVIGIAGELIKGMTITVYFTRDTPEEKINLEELKNIIHKVQWKAFDRIRSRISQETGYSEIEMKLINAAIVDMRIDNYKISNPIGFQGKEIKLSIFNSFAPLAHLGALETIASELNDLKLLGIVSEPFALSKCLNNQNDLSAIFIDIGGTTTDLAVVRDGCLEGTEMFALGGRTLTKRIAAELNISFWEAEKIKIAYTEGRLSKDDFQKIQKILNNDLEVWLSGIELTLSELQLDNLPTKILLCGGGASQPEIPQLLQSREWTKNLSFSRPPLIKFLQPKDINLLTDQTNSLKDQQFITTMALGNIALEMKNEENSPLNSLLKRIVGMNKNQISALTL